MAAVPSIGRATRVERPVAPGADAAGALYERYSAQILSYCMHQLGSREEAEDAVQTTFMNAFRGLSRGIVPELESAWLYKIAHNVCLSRRRSSWRRGRVEAPNNFEVLQEVVPGREQVADELIRLQDVLEQMPENQRRAILLREWQGLTYREIADELSLSQAAVETLIFRARRALAQGLESDADTWRKRLRRGADFGGAVAFLQALLSGGSTAKVAATALAVGTTAFAGSADSPQRQPLHRAAAPAAITTVVKAPTHEFARSVKKSRPMARPKAARRMPARPSTVRTLPHPVAVAPTAAPEAPAPAQAEPTQTAPAVQATPAPSPPPVAAAEPPAPPAPPPAPPSEKEKKDKAERAPQSAQSPPATQPNPVPAVEPLPQPEPAPAGSEHKADKPEKADKPDKPEHPNNGKDQEKRDK